MHCGAKLVAKVKESALLWVQSRRLQIQRAMGQLLAFRLLNGKAFKPCVQEHTLSEQEVYSRYAKTSILITAQCIVNIVLRDNAISGSHTLRDEQTAVISPRTAETGTHAG